MQGSLSERVQGRGAVTRPCAQQRHLPQALRSARHVLHTSMQGNLSEFVKVKPEARTYYELVRQSCTTALPPGQTSEAGMGWQLAAGAAQLVASA